VRSSQTFVGNVAEAGTLATLLTGLNAPPGTLVVSRERTRYFNPEQAIDIEHATGDTVCGQKVFSEDGQEVRLFCYLNLVCSDLACDSRQVATICQKRRKVEEFHKSLKSNVGLTKSPTRPVTT
jgi:hypothetical protein